jgi:hypothetical protein
MSDQPCRVVNIEWDWGHERLDAILRAESADGVIFTEIVDNATVPGHSWIRGNDLLVGKIVAAPPGAITLDHVDSNSRYDEDRALDYPTREIIRVDWGTTYLTALWELLAAGR